LDHFELQDSVKIKLLQIKELFTMVQDQFNDNVKQSKSVCEQIDEEMVSKQTWALIFQDLNDMQINEDGTATLKGLSTKKKIRFE
jgi:hypothetical protein